MDISINGRPSLEAPLDDATLSAWMDRMCELTEAARFDVMAAYLCAPDDEAVSTEAAIAGSTP